MRFLPLGAALLALGCVSVSTGVPQPRQELVFRNPSPAEGDQFGQSVAFLGDALVVGAPGDDSDAPDAGIAYLLEIATGRLLQTYHNPTPGEGDHFGWSVASVGDKVVVGAYADDTGAADSGAAYVFEAATGRLVATLLDPSPGAGDHFGRTAVPFGDKVVIGAYGDSNKTGAVYVFSGSGELLLTITNPRPAIDDRFGLSIAPLGEQLLVGAYGDDTTFARAGAAYLFDGSTGELLRTFENPDREASHDFGISVAAAGGNAVVGSHFNAPNDTDVGIVYMFDASTGKLLRAFRNPTPEPADHFGIPVAASGAGVFVTAPFDHSGTNEGGAFYHFDASTGDLLHTVENPAPEKGAYFGVPLLVAADRVTAGAASDTAEGSVGGVVYLFECRGKRSRDGAP